MKIELRWLVHYVFGISEPSRILQYRQLELVEGPPNTFNSKWSEWMDVQEIIG